jgi:hypothetical protein
MRLTGILGLIAMFCIPAHADETANDIALKAGSRQALVCFRQAEAFGGYQADHLTALHRVSKTAISETRRHQPNTYNSI